MKGRESKVKKARRCKVPVCAGPGTPGVVPFRPPPDTPDDFPIRPMPQGSGCAPLSSLHFLSYPFFLIDP